MKRATIDWSVLETMNTKQKVLVLALLQRMEYTEKKKHNVQEVIGKLLSEDWIDK